jgi:hypothetical protein
MTNNQTRRLATLGSIVAFGAQNPADFAAGTKAADLLGQIHAAETDATSGATGQESHGASMRAGTRTKTELYDELYEDLRAINRTARAIAADMPGLEEKFRMPRAPSYAQVLATARAFLADATGLAASFIEYELPANFLIDLAADIAAFEAAEDDQSTGLTNRVGATRSVEQAIMEGTAALRKLDPLMRNKYRNQPVKLAEWFSTSHVERAARKAEPAVPVAGEV